MSMRLHKPAGFRLRDDETQEFRIVEVNLYQNYQYLIDTGGKVSPYGPYGSQIAGLQHRCYLVNMLSLHGHSIM